ncbi:AraC family transcriptional regulator [Tropicimonas sediminicola]|nr:AraC family transcriptional regulator [Tropicimonas sediminicola]
MEHRGPRGSRCGERFDGDWRPGFAALDGHYIKRVLREGLSLSAQDVRVRAPFEVCGVRAAGVMLHFVLEGRVRASLGGEALELGRGAGEPVRMVMSAANDSMAFRRRGSAGDRVRGVNVEMSHAWLRANGLGALADGAKPSLRRTCGSVLPEDVRLLERLIRLMPEDTPLARLEVEALALRLICSTCAEFAGRAGCGAGMGRDDRRKLARMEQFIEAGQGDLPELSEIARIGNVSLSTMRRMFRAAHGCTVQQYVRGTRLARARVALERDGVTVAEAAHLAGYRSPANFATAFRRATGLAPSHLARSKARMPPV